MAGSARRRGGSRLCQYREVDCREFRYAASAGHRDTLVQAIGELSEGPDIVGGKARDEVMAGLRSLHVARHGRRGSHCLMYRAAPDETIEIVRILHERMDLAAMSCPHGMKASIDILQSRAFHLKA